MITLNETPIKRTIQSIADVNFGYLLVAEPTQSLLFKDNSINTITGVVNKYGEMSDSIFIEKMKTCINNQFRRKFDSVETTVTVTDNTNGTTTVNILVDLIKDGTTYNLGRMLLLENNAVKYFKEINTTGVPYGR